MTGFTVQGNYRFPFGPNERWLNNGGFFAGVAGGWRLNANFSANSGSPQTVTVSGAARDIASGINGALRADYNGEAVAIANPTIDQWFNTAAFTVPVAGAFGTSARNIITGPGSKNLNMTFNRTVQLRGNRNLQITMQLQQHPEPCQLFGCGHQRQLANVRANPWCERATHVAR